MEKEKTKKKKGSGEDGGIETKKEWTGSKNGN